MSKWRTVLMRCEESGSVASMTLPLRVSRRGISSLDFTPEKCYLVFYSSSLALLDTVMKRQVILYCTAAFLACGIFTRPIAAEQQNCAPPVALPVSTEPNIFTEEQEGYL